MLGRILRRWLGGAGPPAPPPPYDAKYRCPFCEEADNYCTRCGSHQHTSPACPHAYGSAKTGKTS